MNTYMKGRDYSIQFIHSGTGLILGLCPANERRRYKVTPSLIGWAQTYRISPGGSWCSEVATSFWRYNDVIMTSCVRWRPNITTRASFCVTPFHDDVIVRWKLFKRITGRCEENPPVTSGLHWYDDMTFKCLLYQLSMAYDMPSIDNLVNTIGAEGPGPCVARTSAAINCVILEGPCLPKESISTTCPILML